MEEANTRLDNLSVAREMEKSDKDAKTIKMATGWKRDADGKWRYEIPDVALKPSTEWINKKNLTLADIVEEENDFFKSYPEAKNIQIKKGRSKGGGSFKFESNEIELGLGDLRQAIKWHSGSPTWIKFEEKYVAETLAHELQYYIQHKEGFALGVNEHTIIDPKVRKRIDDIDEQMSDALKAFFDSEYEDGRKVIFTEQTNGDGKNFIAVTDVREFGHRYRIHVNSIISIYGKDSSARIAQWFDSRNPQVLGLDKDLCLWADTKKASQLLSNNASTVHSAGQSLKRIVKVINNFKDVQFEDEDSSTSVQHSVREENESSEPLFSVRDTYDTKLSKRKKRNGLADDAQPMDKPERAADESLGGFMNRKALYAKDQALWKTAPRPTGFSEALEQWKRDNGIPADEFRPSIPRKADYATEDEYKQARDQYKAEMEKWKGAPKAFYKRRQMPVSVFAFCRPLA